MTYSEHCAQIKADFIADYGHFDASMAFDTSENLITDREFMELFRKEHPEHDNSNRQIIREVITNDLC